VTDPVAVSSIATDEQTLHVVWADGTSDDYAGVWLRDNAPEDRDPVSGQRLTDVADLPRAPIIRAAALAGTRVLVSWLGEDRTSAYEGAWLHSHSPRRPTTVRHPVRTWLNGAALDPRRDLAWLDAATLASDPTARGAWLGRLIADGIAFVSGVACVEGALLETVAPLGLVAQTNYGLAFDVRAVPRPENLAYSDLGLGLHTDNPYREPVPGFQALHALVTAPDGGDSLYADGYALAAHLKDLSPGAYEVLTRTPVPFHYRSQNAELYAERALIALDCAGVVEAVHYNSRSMAPLRLAAADCRAYYDAYRQFAQLLRDPALQVRMRLQDGDLVVFDNRRVLHGRTAFASARHARHLRGCYLTRDSVHSAAALLARNAG